VTRTHPASLLLLAVVGAGIGWFMEVALVAFGHPAIVPPLTLAGVLALIGIIVVALALPIRKAVKGTARARVDPFYATRVLLLAKASSIVGALLSGVALAMLGFFLSRSVVPGVGSVGMSIATVVGAVILLVTGLVAESMCTLPPDEGGAHGSGPGTARL
jgi:Protein of unknown function (DUF3180)